MRMVRKFDRSGWQRCVAGFAAILISCLGLVQSIHLHEEFAPRNAAHSHCALCVFSHSPAVVTASRSAPAPVSDFAALAAAEPQLNSRRLIPSAFIRPPPTL